MRYSIVMTGLLMAYLPVQAQQRQSIDFETYNPRSTLVVPENRVLKSKYPFIDVHNHQRNMSEQDLSLLITEMDKMNMRLMINLSGQGGKRLEDAVSRVRKEYPGRFALFTNINFNELGRKDWLETTLKQLEDDVRNGAVGLKVYKNLGFSARDIDGKRIAVDDPRLKPVWDKCGELRIPVLIHTADPASFWDEPNADNERWLELITHPGRKRGPDNPVPFEALISEQHRMFRASPGTTFIAAHFGWFPNDLDRLGNILDEMPHVMIEFGAVIAELGRQPRQARAFFDQYQDRILFGKDSWVPAEYETYFRVLETTDEYFPYHKKYHAFWRMYGLGLSDTILKKVYYKNALRIIPRLDGTGFQE